MQLPAGGVDTVAGAPDLPGAGRQNTDLFNRLFAEGAAGLHHRLEVADLLYLPLDTVAGGAPTQHLLRVHWHQVRHALLLGAALLQQVGGAVVRGVVDDDAGVAKQQAVDQHVAGEHVQRGAVARDVLHPLVPKFLVAAL